MKAPFFPFLNMGVAARSGSSNEQLSLDLHGMAVRLNTASSATVPVPLSAATDRADSVTIVNKHSETIRVTVTFAAGTSQTFTASNRCFLVDASGGAHDLSFDASNPISSIAIDVPDLSAVPAGSAVSVAALPAINPSSNGYVYVTYNEK